MKKLNIAWAGGGTGGHVFPVKSLIQQVEKISKYAEKIDQQYRFGTKNSMEADQAFELQKNIKNLTFLPIFSGKWRREKEFSALLKNLRDLILLGLGILQSLYRLWSKKIDRVFCKGGYVALPVVFAAKILRVPIFVHESDVHPGLVNRIASRFAKCSFTAFPKVLPRSRVLGQILSDELFSSIQEENKSDGLSTKILVM